MTMPNFLIIGAMKSGTTALYHYLKQHPQIYMSPIKEPNFFAFEGEDLNFKGPKGEQEWINQASITNLETYQQQFAEVSTEIAIGEASATYLCTPKAPERIKHHLPNAKLIAILRNPVGRAYSAFTHLRRDGQEPITNFSEALEQEKTRIAKHWVPIYYYQQLGFYAEQLQRYYELIDRQQIRVYLYEDFSRDPMAILQDIFHFLGVDENFAPDTSLLHNASGKAKNKALNDFLRTKHPVKDIFKPLFPKDLRQRLVVSLQNFNLQKNAPLSPELHQQLSNLYRQDIQNLEKLINRDLSTWLM